MSDTVSIVIADELPGDVPMFDGPLLDLPTGAEQNDDGSVTLTLEYPKTLTFRDGAAEKKQPIATLTFYRIGGADMRKMLTSKNMDVLGFAACTRISHAHANRIINAMDAADGMAAAGVVRELVGGSGSGLPDNATSAPDGVTLSLLFPAEADGVEYTEMIFPRMTVAQRNKAQAQPDLLDFIVGNVTGLTPKQAHDLLDKMDGADFRSVNRVVSFLFGLGR